MAFHVFNPETGCHTRHETEAEARAELLRLVTAFFEKNKPAVYTQLSNEKGDSVWIDTDIDESVTFS